MIIIPFPHILCIRAYPTFICMLLMWVLKTSVALKWLTYISLYLISKNICSLSRVCLQRARFKDVYHFYSVLYSFEV